jgi:adenine-specific DNA-methyltransferase
MFTMDKLKMHSPDLVDANIERIAELFPGCVTESRDEAGKLKRAIDFDLLRQELSDRIVEGPQERYRLDWPGKRKALLTANESITETLRPCREESVDFDTTQNLFVEGDNLTALKLLQETYLGKVKMIYIDPPYNTGKDFIYRDNYSTSKEEFEKSSGERSEAGRLVSNPDSHGRYHSAEKRVRVKKGVRVIYRLANRMHFRSCSRGTRNMDPRGCDRLARLFLGGPMQPRVGGHTTPIAPR